MNGIFSGLMAKLSAFSKLVFVEHAKVCIITGAVAVSGTAGTVTAVVVANNHRKPAHVATNATEAETEKKNDNLEKLNRVKMIASGIENRDDPQYDPVQEDELYQAIVDIVENMGDEPDAEPVPILEMEELEIVEDTSTEPVHEAAVEEEKSAASSTEIYEINQLLHGIDVSRWQGDIDWTKVAADGIDFAIIKCGGGDDGLYEDSKFQQNIQGALANGIPVGVYFFSGARTPEAAYKEASLCVNLIKDYQITYPVCFDWELDYGLGDEEEVTKACETFCNVVASYGYQPMIYSSKYWWYNAFDGEKLSSKFKVWLAVYWSEYYYTDTRWKYGDDIPDFRYNYAMWQYGVTDTVDGIDGYVDMNIAFFGYANYKVNGAQDATLTVDNKTITRYLGKSSRSLDAPIDLMQGVKGTNSIGYKGDVWFEIIDKDNDEVDEDYAFSTPGTYKVVYKFKDPKSGIIKNEATLNIIEVSENLVAKDIEVTLDESKKLPAGTDFTTGVSGTNSLGEAATLAGFVVNKKHKETGEMTSIASANVLEEVFDFTNYEYSVVYTFVVPKDSTVDKTVKLVEKKAEKPSETETTTGEGTTGASQTETTAPESTTAATGAPEATTAK